MKNKCFLSYSDHFRFSMLFGMVAVLFLLASCAPYQARKKPFHYHEVGHASWYGPGFAGKRTASGEVYNPKAMTAAHKTLPFGATVKVRNLDNGMSTVVRINDRGPFVRGRVIDLSRTAAEKIGMIGPGSARVELAGFTAAPDAGIDIPKK